MLKFILSIAFFTVPYGAFAAGPVACPLNNISQGEGWLSEARSHGQSTDFAGVVKGDYVLVNTDLNGSNADYPPNASLIDKVLPREDGSSWADISDSYDNCQSVLYVSCKIPKGSTLKILGFYNSNIGSLNTPATDNVSYDKAHKEYPGIAVKVVKIAKNNLKPDRENVFAGACPEGIVVISDNFFRDELVSERDLELQGKYGWSDSLQEALDWYSGVGIFKKKSPD